jgi:hypothetical protein
MASSVRRMAQAPVPRFAGRASMFPRDMRRPSLRLDIHITPKENPYVPENQCCPARGNRAAAWIGLPPGVVEAA